MIRKHRTGETINISFTFKGVYCREPLSNLKVNPKNIKYAERLLGEIYNKIEKGIFSYVEYFPKSSKLQIFGNKQIGRNIYEYLDEYLDICTARGLSPSTINGYKKCKNALSTLHDISVVDLTPGILKTWIQKQKTSLKTIRNQLSFLRSALDEAVTDGLISSNPASLVTASRYQAKNSQSESDYIVDPLTPKEINAIYNAARYEQWKNLFQFAINTGLRSSELCAIRWDNIDFIENKAHIKSASVVGIIKGTKTKAGTRIVELNEYAIAAINNQRQFTFLKGETIFEDPKTNLRWAGADAIRKKAWVPTLKKAGVRYRNPYQTRHTFAIKHISNGVNLFWLASQMGHKGPEMLFRHYGAYLEEYDGNTSIFKKVDSQ